MSSSHSTYLLCATDGSDVAEKAVDFAIELADKLSAELTFVMVNTYVGEDNRHGAYYWDPMELTKTDSAVERELLSAKAKAEARGLQKVKYVTSHSDDIASAIVAVYDDGPYNHIVLGSHGRTGLKKVMMGSVACGVVEHARCPVTIVK